MWRGCITMQIHPYSVVGRSVNTIIVNLGERTVPVIAPSSSTSVLSLCLWITTDSHVTSFISTDTTASWIFTPASSSSSQSRPLTTCPWMDHPLIYCYTSWPPLFTPPGFATVLPSVCSPAASGTWTQSGYAAKNFAWRQWAGGITAVWKEKGARMWNGEKTVVVRLSFPKQRQKQKKKL